MHEVANGLWGLKSTNSALPQKVTNFEYGIRQLELHIRGCPDSGDVSLTPQYLLVFLPEVRRDKHYSNVRSRPTHNSAQNLNQSSAYDDPELRNFAHRKFVETGAVQTDIEACVDLWHTTVGMHKTQQRSHNTDISKQSSQGHG